MASATHFDILIFSYNKIYSYRHTNIYLPRVHSRFPIALRSVKGCQAEIRTRACPAHTDSRHTADWVTTHSWTSPHPKNYAATYELRRTLRTTPHPKAIPRPNWIVNTCVLSTNRNFLVHLLDFLCRRKQAEWHVGVIVRQWNKENERTTNKYRGCRGGRGEGGCEVDTCSPSPRLMTADGLHLNPSNCRYCFSKAHHLSPYRGLTISCLH